MALRIMILSACALLAMIPITRIIWLLGWRRPVIAHDVSTTCTHAEREADRMDPMVYDFPFPSSRNVVNRERFEFDGRQYRVDVERESFFGQAPASVVTLWINPRNPEHSATARGLGWWGRWLLLLLFIAIPAARLTI